MKPSPLNRDVILHPIEQPGMSEGGIHLPDAWKKKPVKGIVISKGRGCVEHEITPGDVVLISAYAGEKVTLAEGGIFWIIREEDIITKLVGSDQPKLVDTETMSRIVKERFGEVMQYVGDDPGMAVFMINLQNDIIDRLNALTQVEGMEF